MNSYGTVNGDAKILQKICDCIAAGKNVDGHAPFLSGKDLNAYITAGVQSDHECSDVNEALESSVVASTLWCAKAQRRRI